MSLARPGAATVLMLSGLVLWGVAAGDAIGQQPAAYTEMYGGLRDLRPDPTRGAAVEGLRLERDAGTFHFDRGRIHLLEPVAGRTLGAVFVGEGRFELVAPEPVEQRQIRRALGTEAVAQPFRAAVLLFTDFTQSELEGSLEFTSLEPDGDARRELQEAREYFSDGDGWVARDMLLPLLNGGPGWFYAHFSADRGDPLIFSFDPHSFEEVSLSKRTSRGKGREVVAQFHRRMDYESGRSIPQEGLDLVRIASYEIETTIERDLDVVGRATAKMRHAARTYSWVPFRLYSELDVDSVRWGDGSPASFARARDRSDLWVDFSGASGDEIELTFHYSGELMDQPDGLWVVLGTHTTWYPVYEFGREIPYRLTFHAPDRYTVNAVGSRLSETTADQVTTTTWETPPVRMLTFNLGEFESHDSQVADAPGLTVYIDESAHRRLGGLVANAGGLLLEQRDMAQSVALDLRNSFRFFNEVYGRTTVEDFVATEIPYSHGEAYPGLVMLAWNTFQLTTQKGFDEMFRAHEVAHQWWGISVRPATYRDWWLAEGFSEFSGWWYAARARGSIDLYHRRLEETRKAILERRDRSAPIGLGRRVGTSESPEDYQLMVYHKGAWVLHMLRTLLTDPDTGSDDAFTKVMNAFYTKHLGGVASTMSFRQTAEEVVGADLSWFFDQWVYGSAIPTYTFSHTLADQPDGQVKATVRIRQENVPDDFRMIVPILVDFGNEGSAIVRVNVVGPTTEAELPLLPRRPDDIVFNPFESVLAETKTERWSG